MATQECQMVEDDLAELDRCFDSWWTYFVAKFPSAAGAKRAMEMAYFAGATTGIRTTIRDLAGTSELNKQGNANAHRN